MALLFRPLNSIQNSSHQCCCEFLKLFKLRNTATTSFRNIISTTNFQQQQQEQQSILSSDLPSNVPDTFKANDVQIERIKKPNPKPDWDKLIFGHHCSDHMLEIHWTMEDGWQKPKIVPTHPLSLHPFTNSLHYATQCFEGMKAYRGTDGRVRLFRPELNMRRFRLSSRRLCLPDFEEEQLSELIKQLLRVDNDWIPPYESNASLYIRPTMISTTDALGVSPPRKAMCFVVTGPVGPYFRTGFKPVSLMADPKYVRAWPGGCGDRKLGGNYAPTLLIQQHAEKLGHQQVLWLFGPDQKVTEAGTMNIFIMIKAKDSEKYQLLTPPLGDGLILPGCTRTSLIDLVRSWNEMEVLEEYLTMPQVEELLQEKRLLEIFGTGTACIVCPVGRIGYQNRILTIPQYSFGERCFKELLDIQYGIKPAPYTDWIHII